jgi:hypothetical protein
MCITLDKQLTVTKLLTDSLIQIVECKHNGCKPAGIVPERLFLLDAVESRTPEKTNGTPHHRYFRRITE